MRVVVSAIVALLLSMAFTLLAVQNADLAKIIAVPAFVIIGGFLILSSLSSRKRAND